MAPTEAEIRQAIRSQIDYVSPRFPKDGPRLVGELDALLRECGHALDCSAFDALQREAGDDPTPGEDYLWMDLRASEAHALQAVVDAAVQRAASRCWDLIVDELTAAALQFAAKYPDAPRAERTVAA